jgi:hypothetical protein
MSSAAKNYAIAERTRNLMTMRLVNASAIAEFYGRVGLPPSPSVLVLLEKAFCTSRIVLTPTRYFMLLPGLV